MSNKLATVPDVQQIVQASTDDILGVLDTMMEHFNGRFNKVEHRLDKHDEQFDRVLNRLDHFDKTMETDDQERLVIAKQLDRHDTWIHGLADNSGYSLSD